MAQLSLHLGSDTCQLCDLGQVTQAFRIRNDVIRFAFSKECPHSNSSKEIAREEPGLWLSVNELSQWSG